VRGLPLNPTLPGGGLVFELWRHEDGRFFVRAYYITQTLDQMRDLAALGPESPPSIAPIFMPGCGTAGPGFEAPFERVEARWRQLIDPRFVTR
jgi:4-phytase/acid phosphatase